jgi:hypothetical protein
MARLVSSRIALVGAALIALIALAAALGPAGCVLFVPDEQLGTDCHFAGSGSACGECVSTHCQANVNACCADSTCSPALAALERCTTGDPSACGDVGPTGGALGRCLQAACGDACSIPEPDASSLDAPADE